jgi:Domain of unknown function (DUF6438)
MALRVTLMPTPMRLLTGVLLVGCVATAREARAQSSTHGSPHAVQAAAPTTGPEPLITLERTACRGQCAEYRLQFFDDGTVVYTGGPGSSKSGRWRATLPSRTVTQLVQEFQRIGFTRLDDKYPPGINPSSVAITSLRTGDKVKTVTHEVDSPFPPPALAVLEDRLDAAVQSVDWSR